MQRSRFREEQIIGILREGEGGTVKAVCAKHNISDRAPTVRACAVNGAWKLERRIAELSVEHPRYGYRRCYDVKVKEVNAKRVQRVRRAQGLQVRDRQKRMKRVGESRSGRQRAKTVNAGPLTSWVSLGRSMKSSCIAKVQRPLVLACSLHPRGGKTLWGNCVLAYREINT